MSTDSIIETYVNVCNQALELNKHRFPFKQILGAARQFETGKNIEVTVIDDERASSYVFSIQNGRIRHARHSDCGDCQCHRQWKIDLNYLEKIANNAPIYVQNPAKINWEWMYDMTSSNTQ